MKMAFPSKVTLLAANISKFQHTNIWQFQSTSLCLVIPSYLWPWCQSWGPEPRILEWLLPFSRVHWVGALWLASAVWGKKSCIKPSSTGSPASETRSGCRVGSYATTVCCSGTGPEVGSQHAGQFGHMPSSPARRDLTPSSGLLED